MTAAVELHPRPTRRPGLIRRGSGRRLLPVALDLVVAAAICLVGFRYLTDPLREFEATVLGQVMSWIYPGQASNVLPGHVLLFPEGAPIIDAVVTPSCSSILSVLGLTALTVAVLRGRKLHALGGLLFAVTVLLVLNHLRLLLSALAGMWWGDGALVLFHDWVGTLWNLAATLGGFLLMVWVTLPALERAEQDVDGRHTARRPDTWARPGLGYRMLEGESAQEAAARRTTLTGLLHRYVYPRWFSQRLAARRESGRIDYRIGHLPAEARMARIRELAADGLGAHTASLVAVATYEEDPLVLDCLALAVAARQWEPITNHRVASLRLWARGWMLARRPDEHVDDDVALPEETEAAADGATTRISAVARMAVPPRPPPAAGRSGRAPQRQLSFARPTAPPASEETPR
ncbi:exosortase/archaeosortase family protein [Trujillonella endophytica]|uniref:Exosortase/archaeosortase family protein n=1 Tax=Trujillonella endophytica TaxID=673521 RepID=A0A1H8WBN7_9ACTN|nr:exosortase/archaeosortase family protein [Trujillella endophytica]SEP25041.1 exosortase/archaeosortase family protein [Trujillella endophytica]